MATDLKKVSDQDLATELVARLSGEYADRVERGDLAVDTARLRADVMRHYQIEETPAPEADQT